MTAADHPDNPAASGEVVPWWGPHVEEGLWPLLTAVEAAGAADRNEQVMVAVGELDAVRQLVAVRLDRCVEAFLRAHPVYRERLEDVLRTSAVVADRAFRQSVAWPAAVARTHPVHRETIERRGIGL